MSDPRAPVAVVIVAWNARRFIPDCLASLAGLARSPAEIVVVDNASSDGTAAWIRAAHPGVRVIDRPVNEGFCRGNNLGIAATRSPFVLALNPDTRLTPEFLEELLPAFDDPRVGIVCGKLRRFDDVTIDSAGQQLGRSRQPIDRGYGTRDDGRFDQDARVFGACGAAALYRRAMLDAVALAPGVVFDESYFAFYEDLDLAWRARRGGWIALYRHRALGFHARGGSGSSTGPRRFAALAGRSPEIRFHVVKNRWLTLLRNDRAIDVLRDLPWIAARDAGTLVLLAASSPSVLFRLWGARGLFRRALAARRLDAGGRNTEVNGRGAS